MATSFTTVEEIGTTTRFEGAGILGPSEQYGIELLPKALGVQSEYPTLSGTGVSPRASGVSLRDHTQVEIASPPKITKPKAITAIVTLAGLSFLSSMGAGILIAALPRIALDVGLDESLILWPAAVYALACGCTLLIFGAAADAVGPKPVWIIGSFLYVAFTIGSGFVRTGIQLILMRIFLGIAISMCLPTAVSLITNTFPHGNWRNVAFAINGMGAPLGYALGLVLGGIFTDTIGWRWAYYMMAALNLVISIASIWSLPAIKTSSEKKWSRRLNQDVDWIGAVMMSAAFGLLLYVLAITTTSYESIASAKGISMLVISIALLVAFPFWMEFQTKRNKPALIPNKLWKKGAFVSVCVAVFFCWASLNGVEYFTTLYFQLVQGLSPLESSIRFLPEVVSGTVANIAIAYLVSRVKIQTLAVVSAILTMIGPPLLATLDIGENYWLAPFWAMALVPINTDVLFTASNLVISDSFPPELQSLAGGVFNEVAALGNAVGLAVSAAIAASVSQHSDAQDYKVVLMDGYRAVFWTTFACCCTVVIVCFFGFRKSGLAGQKQD